MNTKKVLSALLTSAMVLGSASFTAMADSASTMSFDEFLKALGTDSVVNYDGKTADGEKLIVKVTPHSVCEYDNCSFKGEGGLCENAIKPSDADPKRLDSEMAQYQILKDKTDVTISNVKFVYAKNTEFSIHTNSDWKTAPNTVLPTNGQLQVLNSGNVTFDNCDFEGINLNFWRDNTYVGVGKTATINACTFTDIEDGAGIKWLSTEKAVVTGNTFTDCKAGVMLSSKGTPNVEVSGNAFNNIVNEFIQFAAGSSWTDETANVTIKGNTASGVTANTGIFRFEADSVKMTLENNDFADAPASSANSKYDANFDADGNVSVWPTGKTVKVDENYYASLYEALTKITAYPATVDCKPGADVGTMTHGPVNGDLTINGNGAFVSGGEQDINVETGDKKLTQDIKVEVNSLNGIAAWGERATDKTVNLIFTDCHDMCRVYISNQKDNETAKGAINNITLNNCSFDGTKGHESSKNSSIYSNAKGNITLNNVTFENVAVPVNIKNKSNGTQTITIENCTFTDCATNDLAAETKSTAYAAPIRVVTEGDAEASNVTVKDCTFKNSGEAMGAQILLGDGRENENPTDKVKVTVEGATSAVTIKTDYPEADTRNDSTVTVPAGETASVAMGLADKVAVAFEKADGAADNEAKYDLYIDGDAKTINRLTSAQFTFAINNADIDYEIVGADNVTVTPDNAVEGKYLFNFDGTNAADESGARIKLATVTFTGVGKFVFTVDDTAENQVHATTAQDNIVTTFVTNPDTAKADEGKLELGTGVTDEIKKATCALVVNITFPNAVVDQVADYQDMKVVISGGDLEKNLEYALGSDGKYTLDANGAYKLEVTDTLTKDLAFTVTVSGAGYRTARYTVTMNADKTLNFWNNVKDNAVNVEEKKDTSAKNVTFLAGDIVKDGKINIYDLSAVVSYFGTINDVNEKSEYAKYDLNRDGKIDSKDVAYVLVSWGK